MSRKVVGVDCPGCTTLMSPPCSTMKSRRLPSPALVTRTGEVRPVRTGTSLTDAPAVSTHAASRTAERNTGPRRRGRFIGSSFRCESKLARDASSVEGDAAVGVDGLAGDEAAVVGDQEQAGAGDLV